MSPFPNTTVAICVDQSGGGMKRGTPSLPSFLSTTAHDAASGKGVQQGLMEETVLKVRQHVEALLLLPAKDEAGAGLRLVRDAC